MAGSQLLISNPSHKLSLHNRGISGNKVHQLAARWDKDCLDLKPDVLSILIGVNDIWHGLNGRYDGTIKTYEDETKGLLDYYSDRRSDINANQFPLKVTHDILGEILNHPEWQEFAG